MTDELTYIKDESENPKSSSPGSSRLLRITVQSKGKESHEYVNTVHTADKSRKKRIHRPDYTNLRQSAHTIPTGKRPPYHHPTIVGLFTKEQKAKWRKENRLRSPVHGSVLPCQSLPITLFSAALRASTKLRAPLLPLEQRSEWETEGCAASSVISAIAAAAAADVDDDDAGKKL